MWHLHRFIALGLVLCLLSVTTAPAIPVDTTGMVLDGWNIRPFAGGPTPGVQTRNGITSYFQNNWSPVHYPCCGHQPSPGSWSGETFDLEEMHIRQSGTRLEMLLVSSSSLTATSGAYSFDLGDVLFDFNADSVWDAGFVTRSANNGLVAGGLYNSIDTLRLQNRPGSYLGTAAESQIGRWAVRSGDLISVGSIDIASFNYGGSEGVTHLLELTLDLGPIAEAVPSTTYFHLTWGCGNDVIDGRYEVSSPPTITSGGRSTSAAVPEPLSAGLSVLALGALALALTGRNRPGAAGAGRPGRSTPLAC